MPSAACFAYSLTEAVSEERIDCPICLLALNPQPTPQHEFHSRSDPCTLLAIDDRNLTRCFSELCNPLRNRRSGGYAVF
jgi:hypothetical protein